MNGDPYTDEQDRWLNDNVVAFRWRKGAITEAFNARFCENRSANSIERHLRLIGAPSNRYTEEQNMWIMDHAYLTKADMTRLFNRKFGCFRSIGAISCQSQKLGALRNHLSSKEIQEGNVWTEESDGWLMANAKSYRGRFHELTVEVNHRFGTNFCERAVHTRCERLKVGLKNFTEEQDAWLVEHRGTERIPLTRMFNERFHECRSLRAIQSRMTRLGAYNPNGKRNRRNTG